MLTYLCEFTEKGRIQVNWIQSEDNVADILTRKIVNSGVKIHVKSLGVGNWNLKKEDAPWEKEKTIGAYF
jgi:hypothetical protein